MNKRILVLVLGIVLVVGIALGALFFFTRQQEPLGASPTPETPRETPSPAPGETTTPRETPSPGAVVRALVCPDTWRNQQDTDGDGLPDLTETTYRTDSGNADTDGDGFKDGEEVQNGYDPREAGSARLDSDGDGLLEHEECQWRTDPFNPDTDGDGFRDGDEVGNGFDPTIGGDGRGSDRIRPLSPTPGTTPPPVGTPPSSVNTRLPEVGTSELTTITKSSAADIRAYLAAIDRSRPADLTNGPALADALTSALRGSPQKLAQVRTRIKQYEQALVKTPTPERAVQHHILLISLTRFVYDQLGVMEMFATTDRQRVAAAALTMQQVLPQYVGQLQNLRTQLDALAQGP